MADTTFNPGAHNVRRYRDRMKAMGFRPLQIWVPDTRSQVFADECRRQSLLASAHRAEQEAETLAEQAQDTEGWHG